MNAELHLLRPGQSSATVVLFGMALFASVFFAPRAEAGVTVTASLEPLETEVNQMVQYQVTVTADHQGLPKPELPDIPDVQIVSRGTSQSISIVNGAATVSVAYTFGLVPRKEGVIVIPPSRVQAGGQVFETEAFQLTVHPAGQGPPPPQQAQPADPFEEMFADPFRSRAQPVFNGLMRIVPDKTSVYVNEPVNLSWKLFINGNVEARLQSLEPLSLSGFWAEEARPAQNPPPEGRTSVEGIDYQVYTIQKQTVFPMAAGTKTVPPVKVGLLLQAFMSRGQKILQSQPVEIEVKPLPSGKPAGFKGAVGSYSMSAASDKTRAKQNEAILVRVSVSGRGNIKTLPEPARPDFGSFRLFKTTSSTKLDETTAGISGTRNFEYVLIPLQSGRLTIPSFTFSFFDPSKKSYRTLKTAPISLDVEAVPESERATTAYPSMEQRDIRLMAKDIRYIRPVRGVRHVVFLHRTAVPYVVAGLELLALLAAFVFFLRERQLSGNLKLKRRSRAFSGFKMVWKEFGQEQKTGKIERMVSCLDRALSGYMTDRLYINRSEFHRPAVIARLRHFSNGDHLSTEYERLADGIESIKYAPGAKGSDEEVRTLAADLRHFVEDLESAKESV